MGMLLPFYPNIERPSPPLNFNYTNQTKDSVQLSWETPMNNGGSMITGYIIEKCEDGTDKWLRCNARLCPDLYYRVCSFNICDNTSTLVKKYLTSLSSRPNQA